MKQLEIDLPKSSPVLKIFSLVNSDDFAADNNNSKNGNKSASRRLRKKLKTIRQLCKEGIKESFHK